MINEIVGFEHLHRHTDVGSLLDGYAFPEEYAEYSSKVNQKYLCISDHGMMSAIPRQIKACEEYNLKPIFACELYIQPDHPTFGPNETLEDYLKDFEPDKKKAFRKSYHLLAIAYNDIGYSNLVKLSSWGWLKGYYAKPRVNYDQIKLYKEGIIFTSCCYNGEIGQAFDRGGEEAANQKLEEYIALFGKDHFYLELMLLDFKKQKPYDIWLIKAHHKYGIPLIVSQDCHYCYKEDSYMQQLMLMIQTRRTIQDIQKIKAEDQMTDLFELQDTNLWMKSEEELNEKWLKDYSDAIDYDLFKQAKANTVSICEKVNVTIDRSMKLPEIPNCNEVLKEQAIQGFQWRNLPKTKEYLNRIKEEYDLITRREFSSYFLIQKMMTDEARRIFPELVGWGDGSEAVGPGRGSSCGSLICYCLRITDVDPIKHDLLFSRFLSESRGGKTMKIRFSGSPI